MTHTDQPRGREAEVGAYEIDHVNQIWTITWSRLALKCYSSGTQCKATRSHSLFVPLLLTSHCLYSVLIAPNKAPVGRLMHINSFTHCEGDPINQLHNLSLSFELFYVRVRSLFLSLSLFPFPWSPTIILAAPHQLASYYRVTAAISQIRT